MSLWTVGGTMIIFLAALNDIPKQYYEAIEIDRGNALHRLWNITIPLSSPSIFFNTIMGIIGGFQVFVQPYTLTAGGPNDSSLFYVFYLYREAFTFVPWVMQVPLRGFFL